eukprot:jgi/Bigna1/58941/fgenesh1_kg.2_\
MGMVYTMTSKYATYGRPISEKIKNIETILEGKGIYGSGTVPDEKKESSGYDSDEDRQNRSTTDLKCGQHVDVQDTIRKWLLAEIVGIRGHLVEIHYVNHADQWDEVLEVSSPRLCLKPNTFSRLEKK